MDFCIRKNCSNFAVTIRVMGIFTSIPSPLQVRCKSVPYNRRYIGQKRSLSENFCGQKNITAVI